ncbi:MAG: methyltransferase domain-containing protein [Gammaproteobacteria bacterium]|nr:methyltransferase domain-containing protein [Gammaproteobacteria bacterium]
MSTFYSLGDSESEQDRLVRQIDLYGDTRGIAFESASKVVELGCGSGANLWIARQVSAGAYVGIDARQSHIDAARRRATELGIGNAEFHVADAADTGLKAESFDTLFCRCVFIHQPDPRLIVAEARRILNPGARAIFIEPDGPNHYMTPGKDTLMKVFHARTHYAYGNGRGSPQAARNLYPLLVNAGFKDVSLTPHVIVATGDDPDRCRAFLRHWVEIIEPVAKALVAEGLVTSRELEQALREAQTVTPDLFICHIMWQADATR